MKWGSIAGNTDVLSGGNVWSGGTPVGPAPPANSLWVDVTCDVLDLKTTLGTASNSSRTTRAEAATCSFTLRDPTRKYDPSNPDSPFMFGGYTRLGAGTAVQVFAEVLTDTSTITRYNIHNGTVDTWNEQWNPHPSERRAQVTSSDNTKQLVRLDYPETSAVGGGEVVDARLRRILTYFGVSYAQRFDVSTVPLQATILAVSAWELIGRAVDDELGYVYFDPNGTLQFFNRANWQTRPASVATVGCPGGLDIVTDTKVASADANLINSVNAARTGGTAQVAKSTASITRYGEWTYSRTDLGVNTDADSALWASALLALSAWPRPRLTDVELTPVFNETSWTTVFNVDIPEPVTVVWTPPGSTSAYNVYGRVFGIDHTITYRRWNVQWHLNYADVFGHVMHWGVHAYDRLDRSNVYA